MVVKDSLRLPGQIRFASGRLKSAVAEVRSRSGKPVAFADIHLNPQLVRADVVGGYHDDDGSCWRIWLDGQSPYAAQEAIAAHELAHIVQHLDHFPQAQASGETSQNLIPALNNLVLDDHADRWAIRRGFRIDAALKGGKLPEVMANLAAMIPKAGKETDRSEIQRMGLNYAGLKIRLERFGLFKNIDEPWSRLWPSSRALGISLTEFVTALEAEDGAACAGLFLDLARKLDIHIRLQEK